MAALTAFTPTVPSAGRGVSVRAQALELDEAPTVASPGGAAVNKRVCSRAPPTSVCCFTISVFSCSITTGPIPASCARIELNVLCVLNLSQLTVLVCQLQKGKPVIAKQRVMLKFLWLEKNIGVALDQDIPGHGSVPLSPYYFWPRKDAWEELRAKLESKSWISKKRTIILLNQATDIINLWQQTSSAGQ